MRRPAARSHVHHGAGRPDDGSRGRSTRSVVGGRRDGCRGRALDSRRRAGRRSAAPKAPAKPTSVQIVGKDITDKIIVEPADGSRASSTRCSARSAGWPRPSRRPPRPKANKLGPKYTADRAGQDTPPQQVYDLYPVAAGGPRAHRPAKQPGGKQVADGWFYGRLTMPRVAAGQRRPAEGQARRGHRRHRRRRRRRTSRSTTSTRSPG